VDVAPPADQIADLAKTWPWPQSSVEEILAYDVCEHIGAASPFFGLLGLTLDTMRHPLGRIHFLNEAWRVLTPGGIMRLETPDASRGVGFFQDPTHVSPYVLSTFKYFEHGAFARERLGDSYGIQARFKVNDLDSVEVGYGEDGRERVWKIRAVLQAVK
jgi:predicted SAM-dependent methyltransferase